MTIKEIHTTVRQIRPKCSRTVIYRYLKKLKIRPVGLRTRPQIYPDETAGKVLGLMGYVRYGNSYKLPTMAQLRAQRARAANAAWKTRRAA